VTIDYVEVTKPIYQRNLETVESLLMELRVKRVSRGKKTIPGNPKTVP